MNNNLLNIVCFLWYGDRWNRKDSGVLYVNKLYRAVNIHLTQEKRFICLANVPNEQLKEFDSGIEVLPLDAPSWKGCLPKVCMFNPEYGFKGQVLSFDIDIVITGALDDLANYRGDFAVRSSFHNPKLIDGDIVGFRVGYKTEEIWGKLKSNPKLVERITGGRERYWYRHVLGNNMDTWQKLFPGQLLSYKNHLQGGRPLPQNTRIVSCHGIPRPHQLKEDWAIKNWRDL